jgi:GH24 family phage-related lysozyme (muramidase)
MDANNAVATISSFTQNWEQFSATPYEDPAGSGNYAIGFGNHYYEDGTAVGSDDDPIDRVRALQIMSFYLLQNATALVPQISVAIADYQLGVLTDLRYECGTITVTLLDLINSGADSATVAAQIAQTCTTVGGQPDAGVQARANARANLYASGSSAGGNTWVVAGGLAALGLTAWLLLRD